MVEGCKNKKFVEWFHSKNGYLVATEWQYNSCGILEMSNENRIQCKGCGDVGYMDDWKIACSSHDGDINIKFLNASIGGEVGESIRHYSYYMMLSQLLRGKFHEVCV